MDLRDHTTPQGADHVCNILAKPLELLVDAGIPKAIVRLMGVRQGCSCSSLGEGPKGEPCLSPRPWMWSAMRSSKLRRRETRAASTGTCALNATGRWRPTPPLRHWRQWWYGYQTAWACFWATPWIYRLLVICERSVAKALDRRAPHSQAEGRRPARSEVRIFLQCSAHWRSQPSIQQAAAAESSEGVCGREDRSRSWSRKSCPPWALVSMAGRNQQRLVFGKTQPDFLASLPRLTQLHTHNCHRPLCSPRWKICI